jgi:transketolase
VGLIVEAGRQLNLQSFKVRLVSFPSWELFAKQSQEYRDKVLPERVKVRLAVEAGVSMGWERWVGEKGRVISIERFGASAPVGTIMGEYGMTVSNIVSQALSLLR